MNYAELIAKGWSKNPDGSWSKHNSVRAVEARQCKQPPVSPLDRGVQKRQKGKGSVEIIATLVSCRSRELDDDGNVAALKPLRDAIAETLGLDDADKRIRFEYGQVESKSEPGVLVKITRIKPKQIC